MNELEKIAAAAEGLEYMSETDHPFEISMLPGEGDVVPRLLQAFRRDAGTNVETQDLAYFFRNMVKTYEGATEEDLARAERFKKLQAMLEQTLRGLVVYRLGEVTIDAVITGALPDGRVVALRTKLVET